MRVVGLVEKREPRKTPRKPKENASKVTNTKGTPKKTEDR